MDPGRLLTLIPAGSQMTRRRWGAQVQDFAFPFAVIHEILACPYLHPDKVPVKSNTIFWATNHFSANLQKLDSVSSCWSLMEMMNNSGLLFCKSLCDILTKGCSFSNPTLARLDTFSIFFLDHLPLLPLTVCFIYMCAFCQKPLVHLCRSSLFGFLHIGLQQVILENQQDVIMSIWCLISWSKDIPKITFALYVLNSEEM